MCEPEVPLTEKQKAAIEQSVAPPTSQRPRLVSPADADTDDVKEAEARLDMVAYGQPPR